LEVLVAEDDRRKPNVEHCDEEVEHRAPFGLVAEICELVPYFSSFEIVAGLFNYVLAKGLIRAALCW
jgi:hypothetical protein